MCLQLTDAKDQHRVSIQTLLLYQIYILYRSNQRKIYVSGFEICFGFAFVFLQLALQNCAQRWYFEIRRFLRIAMVIESLDFLSWLCPKTGPLILST